MGETGEKLKGSCSIEEILEVLKTEIAKAKEKAALPPLALLLVDIDNLERVNRWFGRNLGNEVLDFTAKFLGGQIKTEDLLTRFGGDEFLVLLRGITLKEAKEKASEILSAVKQSKFTSKGLKISVSIGIAHYFSFAFSGEEFLGCVVEALASAQKEGGTFKVFMEEEDWNEKQ